MVDFQNFVTDISDKVHVGILIPVIIIFSGMITWVGWSLFRFFCNMFGFTDKKEDEEKTISNELQRNQ